MDQKPIYLVYGWYDTAQQEQGITLGKFRDFSQSVQLMAKWNNNPAWIYYFMPQNTEYDFERDHTKDFIIEKELDFFQKVP